MEEEDFSPAMQSSLKFAKLFDVDCTTTPLNYSPPKAPLKTAEVQKPQLQLLYSKAVHAFQLVEGQYVTIGRLGLALVGSIRSQTFQLLLYANKKEVLCRINVQREPFLKHSTGLNFAFGDFCVSFDTKSDAGEFARNILLGRFYSSVEPLREALWEDIVLGDPSRLDFQIEPKVYVMNDFFLNETENFHREEQKWREMMKGCSAGHQRAFILPSENRLIQIELMEEAAKNSGDSLALSLNEKKQLLEDKLKLVKSENKEKPEVLKNPEQLMLKMNQVLGKVDEILGKVDTGLSCNVLTVNETTEYNDDLVAKLKAQQEHFLQLLRLNQRCLEDHSKTMQNQVNSLKEELVSKQKDIDFYKKLITEKTDQVNESGVKKLMNGLYRDLISQFNESNQYEGSEIRKIIAEIIKESTRSFLNERATSPV